jgi:hypothetical protein
MMSRAESFAAWKQRCGQIIVQPIVSVIKSVRRGFIPLEGINMKYMFVFIAVILLTGCHSGSQGGAPSSASQSSGTANSTNLLRNTETGEYQR